MTPEEVHDEVLNMRAEINKLGYPDTESEQVAKHLERCYRLYGQEEPGTFVKQEIEIENQKWNWGNFIAIFLVVGFIAYGAAVNGWHDFNRYTGERYQVLRQASETKGGRVNAIVYDRRLETTYEIDADGHFSEIEDQTEGPIGDPIEPDNP
jgi:hypothetical protein